MNRRTVLALAGPALAALVLTGCGGASDGAAAAPAASSAVSSAAQGAGAQAARTADVAFAQMMIPHHQQAVEMSDLALEKATTPQVRELATAIQQAQDPEIRTMQGWLSAWGAPEGMGDHAGHAMPGMMGEQDLADLAAASGADFDRRWLEMMVAHHEGALEMARSVLGTTQDPQVRSLAEAVVSGQTAEIATMKGLLAG